MDGSVIDGWTWRLYAACRDTDPAPFFAPNYFEARVNKREREARAKELCARCPVRQPCLDYAIRHNEEHGVWGGLNEVERRALRRQLGEPGVAATAAS
jgi:WhiB family redox-sensing transcriptional regulator